LSLDDPEFGGVTDWYQSSWLKLSRRLSGSSVVSMGKVSTADIWRFLIILGDLV